MASSKEISPKGFITLKKAVDLNNRIVADQAWVLNSNKVKVIYSQVLKGDTKAMIEVKAKAFLKAEQNAKNDPDLHEQCWEIQRISNFVNNEQIQWLIAQGRFYYAVKENELKKKAMMAGIEL